MYKYGILYASLLYNYFEKIHKGGVSQEKLQESKE